MKKIISVLLITLLLFASGIPIFSESTPSQADGAMSQANAASAQAGGAPSPKEEVVYGILGPDGSIENLYVVNIFSGGPITDYGSYSEVRNLTTSEKLQKNGDQITASASADRFSYQGTLEKKELPWDIAIQYYIDGSKVSADELAGKSGSLKIAISVKQNSSVSKTFFNNYALQITVALDSKLCSNIKADNATIAEAGGKKQLAFTVLPGSGADISVTADVRDFEMDPITINGIKMAFDIPVDTGEFTGQLSELTDAVKKLDDGAGELAGGIAQLADGVQKYTDGLKAFKDGLGQLATGAGRLDAGAAALKNGLSELAKQKDLLTAGAAAMQQAAFDAANASLAGMGLELPQLTPENYSTVLSAIPELAAVKNQLDGAVQFTQGLRAYTQGVSQLGAGASDLSNGLAEFNASSALTAQSANELYKAASDLNEAVKQLKDGLAAYKDGTKKLKDGTADIDSEIEKQVDEILGNITGSGDKTISFVSEKNTDVSSVQFVLKTKAISIPKAEKPAAAEPVRLTLWQKLLRLFGLYK